MVNSRIKKNRSIRRPTKEAFIDHHMLRKNTQEHKKLIKRNNKRKRPPEHFKHHLEQCPWKHPPTPTPPLPLILSHPVSRFFIHHSCSTLNHVCVFSSLCFIMHLSSGVFLLLSQTDPASLWRSKEQRKTKRRMNKLLFNAGLAQCPSWWS